MEKIPFASPSGERFALTLTQQDIYFDQLRHVGRALYNVGGYIQMGNVDVAKLSAAHHRVVHNEAAFGIRIVSTDLGVEQYISHQRTTQLAVIDFSSQPEPQAHASQWLRQQFETPLNIDDCELFKAMLIKLADDNYWYAGIAHHLAMDGWGFANWAKRLGQVYNDDAEQPLPAEHSEALWRNIALDDSCYIAVKSTIQIRIIGCNKPA